MKKNRLKIGVSVVFLSLMISLLSACSGVGGVKESVRESVKEAATAETTSKEASEAVSEAASEVTTETTTEAMTEEVKKGDFNPTDYRNDINYESLCRKPDEYKGMKIYMSGRVNSMLEEDEGTLLQIDVGEGLLMVLVDPSTMEVRVLENDEVTFFGEYQGLGKYETVMGQTQKDPFFIADKVNIDSYDDTMEAPTGALRSGTYSVKKTEGDFIYSKTAKFTYQDGDAFGCEIRVVREIVDRGDATILGDIFCFLKDEGEGVYTGTVSGKGSIKVKAYESSIKVETTPDAGMEASFEEIADEYSFGEIDMPDVTTSNTTGSDGDYIFPFSNSRNLTEEDIAGMDKDKIALARNEIYARHGYIFQDESFRKYFISKTWYIPKYTGDQFDDSVLNSYERQNVQFLLSHE
ncbi:MAG: YARHG domain-containing protein [Eubacterium sp.]|nr:YARHG domain-containing protein [Eubacterium sp.]